MSEVPAGGSFDANPPKSTPGRTHFSNDADSPRTIATLARELADAGAHDDAASLLEAFVAAYPDQLSELEAWQATMVGSQRLSACLIAKNERENVEACLASFADHVDEIVFVDTGSRDGTVAEVRRVCRQHGWADKLVLGRFRWVDDFAAARNHAASLATGDVHLWVDLDDRVIGAENLRAAASLLTDGVDHVYARYVSNSRNTSVLTPEAGTHEEWRPRLFRAPVRWINPTWETPAELAAPGWTDSVWWWHHKTRERGARDLKLARGWVRREPRNFLAWWAYASEAFDCEAYDESLSAARRLLRWSSLTDGDRARVHGLMSEVLRWLAVIGEDPARYRQAEWHADRSFALSPIAQGTLVSAQCAFLRNDYEKASHRARWLLENDRWISRHLLISAGRLLCYSEACRQRWREALLAAETTLPLIPTRDPRGDQLRAHMQQWRRWAASGSPR